MKSVSVSVQDNHNYTGHHGTNLADVKLFNQPHTIQPPAKDMPTLVAKLNW